MERKMKTIEEWRTHWDNKKDITNPIELNGYCLKGKPIEKSKYNDAVIQPTLELLELDNDSKILDVGCGSGMFLYEFEKMGLEAFGTDISNALLERFKGKSKTFACAAHELPFYDEFFNRILMVSVAIYFENFNYFKTVVLKCLSILKLQGIFLIGDINLGIKPDGNQYQWYNKHEMVDFLDSLGYPYSIMTQNKIKRTINKRWDILIYKE